MHAKVSTEFVARFASITFNTICHIYILCIQSRILRLSSVVDGHYRLYVYIEDFRTGKSIISVIYVMLA